MSILLFFSHCLTDIRLSVIYPIHDELSFSIILEIFLGSLYVSSKPFWISCISVSLFLASLPSWNCINIGYVQWWMHYFLKSCEDLFKMCLHLLQIISDFWYVCQSVYWLISFEMRSTLGISRSGWAIFLKFMEKFLGCFYTS